MKNTNLESAVADTNNIEMTSEIEHELNKIYEKKEKIDMKNNNIAIKRGTQIKNGKDATTYTLMFLKDTINMYLPYLLDWSDWIEKQNDYVKKELVNNLTEMGEDKKVNFIKKVKLENGLCRSIANENINKIENAIKIIAENKEFVFYKSAIKDIQNSVEKLGALVSYLHLFYVIGFLDDNLSFYENIVSTPIFKGLEIIEEIIEELENVTEETLEMQVQE